MADKKAEIKQDIKSYIEDQMKTTGVKLDQKGMKKEGTDSTADYIGSVATDVMGNMLGQSISSPNFYPTVLDPTLYDTMALYQLSPLLTYLESRGRRFPATTTAFDYIQFGNPHGFADQWLATETTAADAASGDDAHTTVASASMCFQVVPYSLSDLIGMGQSATSRAQLMDFILETMREGHNNKLINGDEDVSGEFDGLFTLSYESGTKTNMAGAEITLDDIRAIESDLAVSKKGFGTFCLTDNYTMDSVLSDMTPTLINMNQVQNLVAGVDVTGWQSKRGRIPIIVDPYSPSTAYNATANAKGRRFGIFNERSIFIHDLITPSWVEKGRSKPLATDGWIVQATVMYNTIPEKTADLYGIK